MRNPMHPMVVRLLMRGALSAVAALILGLVGFARFAGAEPILYASWHAPYGDSTARDTLTGRCDDAGADTLCLSFDPGEDIETFYAVSATIEFRAIPPDTLSERWWFGGGEGNYYNVRVHMDAESTETALKPWAMQPVGAALQQDQQHGAPSDRLRTVREAADEAREGQTLLADPARVRPSAGAGAGGAVRAADVHRVLVPGDHAQRRGGWAQGPGRHARLQPERHAQLNELRSM